MIPTREQNDDMTAHRVMVRLETIMHYYLHALNSGDDRDYEQSILVTLQLITDTWASLNKSRMSKILNPSQKD